MMILASLYALEILTTLYKMRAKIHIMREDGLYEIFLRTPLVPLIGKSEMRLLHMIKEKDLNNMRRSEVVKNL